MEEEKSKSVWAKFKSTLRGGGSSKSKTPDGSAGPSPLRRDSEQQRIVQEAMAKSPRSNKSPKSPRPASGGGVMGKLKDQWKAAISPRKAEAEPQEAFPGVAQYDEMVVPDEKLSSKNSPQPVVGTGVPPPLPKKVRGSANLNFIFCGSCGARNKKERTVCVSCGDELEVPEMIKQLEAQQAAATAAAAAPPPPKKKPDPVECECDGPGLEDGKQNPSGLGKFVIEAYDKEGAVETGGDPFEVEVEGPRGAIEPEITDHGDGTYSVQYDQQLPGRYRIFVFLDDYECDQSPYEIEVEEAVSAAESTCSGQALEDGVFSRNPCTFVLEVRNVCGALVTSGGHSVEVHLDGREHGDIGVDDLENGTYEVTLEYADPGQHEVEVLLEGMPIVGCPYVVRVDKPPSAGSRWQAQYEAEAEDRRQARQRERDAEIAEAKENYLKHAAEAVEHARTKEEAQLAEEERQASIAAHMERMRTEEGDAVRADVLEKLQAQAADDIYEPVDEEALSSPRNAGKKWAHQFLQEDGERRRQREEDRKAEIEAARDKYQEHQEEAARTARAKEEQQLAEEERQRQIKDHQATLRKEANLGGRALLEGDETVSSVSDDGDDYEPSESGTSVSEEAAEPEPLSSEDEDEDEDVPAAAVAAKSPKRKARVKRGEIPDTGGVVLTYDEIKRNGASLVHDEEVQVEYLEAYLSDEEFNEVFRLSKKKFYALPPWRRRELKKEKGL